MTTSSLHPVSTSPLPKSAADWADAMLSARNRLGAAPTSVTLQPWQDDEENACRYEVPAASDWVFSAPFSHGHERWLTCSLDAAVLISACLWERKTMVELRLSKSLFFFTWKPEEALLNLKIHQHAPNVGRIHTAFGHLTSHHGLLSLAAKCALPQAPTERATP